MDLIKDYWFVLVIFLIFVLTSALVGIHQQEKLNEEHPVVETHEDIVEWMESCRLKGFLDCEQILIRKLKEI